MTDIIHLAKTEHPPVGLRYLLIEVAARRRNESGEENAKGLILKISRASYEAILADCRKKGEAAGMAAIYVRGVAQVPAGPSDAVTEP